MTEQIAPIRKEIVVEAPQERAFRVFTERLDAWYEQSRVALGGKEGAVLAYVGLESIPDDV